jgi:solute carrier family 31 (copper transporter), member 1
MLFTWSTQDLCIIFRGWHVHNTFSLILSLLAIVALCAGYEAVREVSRRYEAAIKERLANIPSKSLPPYSLAERRTSPCGTCACKVRD